MVVLGQDFLDDALSQLAGWSGDIKQIHRTLEISDSQHADLTERTKVFADAMRLRPDIRRVGDRTQISIGDNHRQLTARHVALAARIEDAYRTVTDH